MSAEQDNINVNTEAAARTDYSTNYDSLFIPYEYPESSIVSIDLKSIHKRNDLMPQHMAEAASLTYKNQPDFVKNVRSHLHDITVASPQTSPTLPLLPANSVIKHLADFYANPRLRKNSGDKIIESNIARETNNFVKIAYQYTTTIAEVALARKLKDDLKKTGLTIAADGMSDLLIAYGKTIVDQIRLSQTRERERKEYVLRRQQWAANVVKLDRFLR